MKIILSGGATLGPVIPLLAIVESYRERYPDTQFLWVGTKHGPEKELIQKYNIPFFSLSTGKWRRYSSLLNIIDLCKIVGAFVWSLYFLLREKPNLLISAGGFVSVPLHWAAALLAMPMWVHQQDARVGLANKLMFPSATKVTVALGSTSRELKQFSAEWIGNPSRDLHVSDKNKAREKFHIPFDAPVVFAMGGGTGSASVNKLILEALPHWPRAWQVIHLVGKDRPQDLSKRAADVFQNYHVYEFFSDEMKDAYAVADVVVARAGFSTLSEIAMLEKAAVIIPMSGTHQEDNTTEFEKEGGIQVLHEDLDSGLKLAAMVKRIMDDPGLRARMGQCMHRLLPRTKKEKVIHIIDSLV